jgi:hypothetical protein
MTYNIDTISTEKVNLIIQLPRKSFTLIFFNGIFKSTTVSNIFYLKIY